MRELQILRYVALYARNFYIYIIEADVLLFQHGFQPDASSFQALLNLAE